MFFFSFVGDNMAGNPPEGLGDDFLEQILAVQPPYTSSEAAAAAAAAGYVGGEVGSMPMVLQLGSGDHGLRGMGLGMGSMAPPLGLNQQQAFLRQERFREDVVDGNNNCHNNSNNGSSSSAISVSFSLCGLVCSACHFAFVQLSLNFERINLIYNNNFLKLKVYMKHFSLLNGENSYPGSHPHSLITYWAGSVLIGLACHFFLLEDRIVMFELSFSL